MPKLGFGGQELLASRERAFEGEGAAGGKVWGEEWPVGTCGRATRGLAFLERSTVRQEVVRTRLKPLRALSRTFITSLCGIHCYHLCLVGEETEAEGGSVTAQSQPVSELRCFRTRM